jgi:ABC-type multidrug transport system ATPase subunit
MLAIHTQSLNFQYKKKETVLSGIDLEVPSGAVFGLLGQNGAGKTTLLKLLLGLLKPQTGTISLLGKTPKDKIVFHQLGSVIEGPHLYHHLTGRQNLELFGIYRQVGKKQIDLILAQIGLSKQADKKVGQYSTGMKQRLAIGLALLSDPALLILDEPTNGLDPEGIADIRQLIRQLSRDEHRTIIFSSHILSEVEQVCTHIGILKDTELIFQGTYESLKKQVASSEVILLQVDALEKALNILTKLNWPVAAEEQKLRVQIRHPDDVTRLIDLLRGHQIRIYRIESEENRLEHFFLNLG